MTPASALTGPEAIPMVQGGANVKSTPSAIATFIGAAKDNATGSDPGVSNDNTQGYAAGSLWVNTTTGWTWVCRDASTGAAVWNAVSMQTHPGYQSGRYYIPAPVTTQADNLNTGSCWYTRWMCMQRVTLNSFGMFVTTGSAATTFLIGLYNSSGGQPSTLLTQPSSSLSSATSGVFVSQSLSAPYTIDPGLYFFGVMTSSSTPNFSCEAYSPIQMWALGMASPSTTNPMYGFKQTQAYGSGLPASASGLSEATLNSQAQAPIVWFSR